MTLECQASLEVTEDSFLTSGSVYRPMDPFVLSTGLAPNQKLAQNHENSFLALTAPDFITSVHDLLSEIPHWLNKLIDFVS